VGKIFFRNTWYNFTFLSKNKKMNIVYENTESVKPLIKFINREQTLRSNWIAGESNSSLLGSSTWSEKKREKVKKNYINRISEGKVKVFYLEIIEYALKETDCRPAYDWIYSGFTTKINKINTWYRLNAYYQAIQELELNHRIH
jgi:hypothetical protein